MSDSTLFVLCGLALVVLLMLAGYAAVLDERQWNAFASEHHCKVIGHDRGGMATTIAPVISGNGGVAVGITSLPSKTGYLCDDQVTYWR